MEKKERLNVFAKELDLINDSKIKKFAKILIENADDWFFTIPASTSGKFHPEYARGAGGLILHTKAVIYILDEILKTNMYEVNERQRDLLKVAALAHDIKKIGDGKTGHTVENHPFLATHYINDIYEKNKKLLNESDIEYINNAVRSHMGQYGDKTSTIPITDGEKLLHISDMIASRKNIEIIFEKEELKKSLPNINEYVIDFGMHSGKHLNEIPIDYIEWCIDNIKQKPVFISIAKRFLKEQKKNAQGKK